jgi:hypothetical protein
MKISGPVGLGGLVSTAFSSARVKLGFMTTNAVMEVENTLAHRHYCAPQKPHRASSEGYKRFFHATEVQFCEGVA